MRLRYLRPWETALLLAILNTLTFILFDFYWGITAAEVKTVAMLENLWWPQHVAQNAYYQILTPDWDWRVTMNLGLIAGAFTMALLGQDLKLRVPRDKRWLLVAFTGGVFMGFGARMNRGCNIGHIISGLPQFSLASIIATVFIIAGVYAGTKILGGLMLWLD